MEDEEEPDNDRVMSRSFNNAGNGPSGHQQVDVDGAISDNKVLVNFYCQFITNKTLLKKVL